MKIINPCPTWWHQGHDIVEWFSGFPLLQRIWVHRQWPARENLFERGWQEKNSINTHQIVAERKQKTMEKILSR